MGSKLYVVGGGFTSEGKNRSDILNDGQTLVLDLSVSWDAANPSWKRLKDGPKQMDFAGALSADGSKLVTFRSGANVSYAMIYDVATDTWSPSKVTVSELNRVGLSAVTDPTTNRVYLPFGTLMNIYDFNTDTMAIVPSRGAWWSKRQSIVYFGGYVYPEGVLAPNFLTVYTPSSNTWSTLTTTGTGSDSLSTVNDPVLVYNIKRNQYLSRYTVEPSPDLSGSPNNEGKPSSDSGSSKRFSTGAVVGIFLGAALGTAFLVWGVRYNMEKRKRLKKGGSNDEGASGNTTNTSKPPGGETDAYNPRSTVMVESLPPCHRGYRLPYSHAPHEHPPTSQNAPQNFSNDLPGYMMDHATRGPEGTSFDGHGDAGNTPFEDLGSWRDRQWNVRSVGSPHRLLEPETLRSPQRWKP
ncbi:hypothetical protein BGX34_009711 [Mortierella sp. NVP85]|nr:hypothetical protein BGX34_009711 [Mortierella sp. NVP85]